MHIRVGRVTVHKCAAGHHNGGTLVGNVGRVRGLTEKMFLNITPCAGLCFQHRQTLRLACRIEKKKKHFKEERQNCLQQGRST